MVIYSNEKWGSGMHLSKKDIPNCITSVRIAGAVALFFVEPFSLLFYVIYTACGVTDVFDGYAARKLEAVSEFGSLLDSIADLVFYAVMLIYVIPHLWKRVPKEIWLVVGVIIALRVISYLTAWVKYHRFASLHTYGNKITGAFVFSLPYLILILDNTFVCVLGCIIGMASTLEELAIHLKSDSYNPKTKTILYLLRDFKK